MITNTKSITGHPCHPFGEDPRVWLPGEEQDLFNNSFADVRIKSVEEDLDFSNISYVHFC